MRGCIDCCSALMAAKRSSHSLALPICLCLPARTSLRFLPLSRSFFCRVTESDLSSELHLSPKLVREILHRLRQDQIVRGVQKSEAAPKVEELTSKGRKKNYTRAPTVTFMWFVDFDQLVNVIKFRHWDIFEKLNKKVDRSEVFYVCPTPHCENHSPQRKRSVMDLLLDQRTAGGATDGIFRCEVCFTIDTLTNTKHATPLVLLTHQETSSSSSSAAAAAAGGSSSAAAASSSALPLGVDPSENLKNKFNKQLGVILEQLMKVDRMLQEDVAAKKEQVAAGIVPGSAAAAASSSSAAAAAASDQKGSMIDFSQANAVASHHAAAAAAAAASGGAAALQSVEDMISVSLSSGPGGSEGPAAKRVKMDSVISSINRDALPWDKNAPLSLAKVEEEKAAQQHARSLAAEQEQARRDAKEKERFQKEYKEQLAKAQQAAAVAAALHERETQAAAAAAAAAASAAQHAYSQQQPTHDMHTDEQVSHHIKAAAAISLLALLCQSLIFLSLVTLLFCCAPLRACSSAAVMSPCRPSRRRTSIR